MKTAILGRGRVGRGLAAAATFSHVDHVLLSGRTQSAEALNGSELIVLAVVDSAIEERLTSLIDLIDEGVSVVHCSGSLGLEAFGEPPANALSLGMMHPLVSFAQEKAPTVTNKHFLIAGEGAACERAAEFASAIGAIPTRREVHGPLYHAAAALAANGAAALATEAVAAMQHAGLNRAEAQDAVGALLETVGENVRRVGVPNALSGPVQRGDALTVRRHLDALRGVSKSTATAYARISDVIVNVAREGGLAEDRVEALRSVLAGADRD